MQHCMQFFFLPSLFNEASLMMLPLTSRRTISWLVGCLVEKKKDMEEHDFAGCCSHLLLVVRVLAIGKV